MSETLPELEKKYKHLASGTSVAPLADVNDDDEEEEAWAPPVMTQTLGTNTFAWGTVMGATMGPTKSKQVSGIVQSTLKAS